MNEEKLREPAEQWWQTTFDGGIPVGWFFVAHGVDAAGERWVGYAYENLKLWEMRGLLTDILDGQLAEEVAQTMGESGDS